jgi:hypothetical protein
VDTCPGGSRTTVRSASRRCGLVDHDGPLTAEATPGFLQRCSDPPVVAKLGVPGDVGSRQLVDVGEDQLAAIDPRAIAMADTSRQAAGADAVGA